MGPTGRLLDQGQAQGVVDGSQAADPHARAKLGEHARIGSAMPMGKAGKLAPSALLGQQFHQLVERVCGRQHCQQVDPPQLCRAQSPVRPSQWASVPVLVDEVVGNIRVEQRQQLCRASHGKCRVHGSPDYPSEPYLSVKSAQITNPRRKSLAQNTLQQNS
jgi:hypothetical protein